MPSVGDAKIIFMLHLTFENDVERNYIFEYREDRRQFSILAQKEGQTEDFLTGTGKVVKGKVIDEDFVKAVRGCKELSDEKKFLNAAKVLQIVMS